MPQKVLATSGKGLLSPMGISVGAGDLSCPVPVVSLLVTFLWWGLLTLTSVLETVSAGA